MPTFPDEGFGFRFDEYGPREKDRLADAILALSIRPNGKGKPWPTVCQPLEEAWLVGTFDEVLSRVDEVTQNTVRIGQRFIGKSRSDPSWMSSFHWIVGRPDPCLTCLLYIGLCLVAPSSRPGGWTLAQDVLRVGKDEFVYWGVD